MSGQNQSGVVFLRGDRVILRPVSVEDVPLMLKWINNPNVRKYLSVPFPTTEGEEMEWIENLHKRKQNDVTLAIEVDGKIIGTMGLHRIHWRNRVATTGTLIGEEDFWGKGYGTEAKMHLLNYAFNTLNLRKICSSVLAFNERSYRYGLRCGYREEGRLKQHHFHDGQYHDEILLAVFRDDWLPLWEEFQEK